MNVDDLTIGQAKELAAKFAGATGPLVARDTSHEPIPVVVCTDKHYSPKQETCGQDQGDDASD